MTLNTQKGSHTSFVKVETKAVVHQVKERKGEFEIVSIFQKEYEGKKELTEYIALRQMALIREFKSISAHYYAI